MKILFIGKKNDFYVEKAADFLKLNNPDTKFLFGKRGDKIPEEIFLWKGEYIISYLSPWIIPQILLNRSEKASINFHPGPPEYPGIGCTNFAIYNEEKDFGVTCHYMDAKVDIGEIIAIERFPIFDTDTVFSITQRCYSFILSLFYRIVSDILTGKKLPKEDQKWKRKPYKRKELNELCIITPDMTEKEIKKRIKATDYPNMPSAYIELGGEKFIYKNKE